MRNLLLLFVILCASTPILSQDLGPRQADSLKKALETDKPQLQDNKELIRKLYLELVATPEYQQYITVQGRDKKSEKEILEFIFSEKMLAHETFLSHVEELYTNWDDDGEMISQLVMSYLAKPGSLDFQQGGDGRLGLTFGCGLRSGRRCGIGIVVGIAI